MDTNVEDNYFIISYEESQQSVYKSHQQAAHGMLFSYDQNSQRTKAAILMIMRSDGYIGFPGGLIECKDTNIVSGLNRELHEELGVDANQQIFDQNCHLVTFVHNKMRFLLHFYMKQVMIEEIANIEKRALNAKDFGTQILGTLRVPCQLYPDNTRGLPVFLASQFIANARDELIVGLKSAGIFTEKELSCIMKSSERYKKNNS